MRPLAGGTQRRDDQARVATPGEAIRAGADYLVVGRPITAASDPEAAARAIIEEMAAALASRRSHPAKAERAGVGPGRAK